MSPCDNEEKKKIFDYLLVSTVFIIYESQIYIAR